MKDTTIKQYSGTHSAIQDISITDNCSGLDKYTALIVLMYKEKVKEFKVHTWTDNKEDAKRRLNKLRLSHSFEILKYQFKI